MELMYEGRIQHAVVDVLGYPWASHQGDQAQEQGQADLDQGLGSWLVRMTKQAVIVKARSV